jgi:biopolymer transport protein ExbD
MNGPIRLRRNPAEVRIEIVPLIDVIFLVLTFFIYAMVLMIPAKLLPLRLQAFAAGESARTPPAVSISIDAAGSFYLDREPVALEDVLPRVLARVEAAEGTVVFIAADDRGPVAAFKALYQRLADRAFDIRLVGSPPGIPSDSPAPGSAPGTGTAEPGQSGSGGPG